MFQSIIISFFPRQWLSVTRCFGRAPSQILGIPSLTELFLTTKTKKKEKKKVECWKSRHIKSKGTGHLLALA